jgi:hypothetical protein
MPKQAAVISFVVLWMTTVCGVKGSSAWYDETHVAIAKVAGYGKWFNAAAADVAKFKMGALEGHNHFVNNPRGRTITVAMVRAQISKYDTIDPEGHLYGAILASLRAYIEQSALGVYAQNQLAYCAHYVGDLSMPLHNILYNEYNEIYHHVTDGIINDEALVHLEKIRIYPIRVESQDDLAAEVARIANLSMQLGYRLEAEKRLLTTEEAFRQISHSASLLRAVLEYTKTKATQPSMRLSPMSERQAPRKQ